MATLMLVYILPDIISINVIIINYCKMAISIHSWLYWSPNKQVHKIERKNKTAILPFSKLCIFSNHNISTDTKGPSNPASGENRCNFVIVDHFCKYFSTTSTLKIRMTLLKIKYFIFGFLNLVHLKIQSLVKETNILFLRRKVDMLCLIIVLLQELHLLLGQMDLLKYKKNLGFYLRKFLHDTPENGLSKYISLLMLTILKHSPICIFQHQKESFISSLVLHWIFK